MQYDDEFIKKCLIEGNYSDPGILAKAEESAKNRRNSLLDFLLSEGIITKDLLGQAIAEHFKISYSDLNTKQPPKELVLLIPEEFATQAHVVVVDQKKENLIIATDDPTQADLVANLQEIFPSKKIKLSLSLTEDIESCFANYETTIQTTFTKIIESGTSVAPELLELIFTDSVDLHASDIHFEPNSGDILLRFRIDGVLRDIAHLPRDLYGNILNRIKVQSGIRLDEHNAAQDGAMQFTKDNTVIDLRTSIVPTIEGEKVVLRILSSYIQGLTLAELGLSESNEKILINSSHKPYGMIVVAGPTGSGKTTTLYALLKMLNQSSVNITTIEDPVEYKMKGVNQIQVNPQTNLTFAKGLRSIVRQDPNIILVGEIRDAETAEIAVNASLTGHLLLSTFHANDAATSIPRLLDMGVEPFLLASTFELAIAQRLVRRLCQQCRYSIEMDKCKAIQDRKDLKKCFPEKEFTLFQSKGCNTCGNTGYKGRTAIFEMIQITQDMQNLILKHPSTQEIWELARRQGSRSLFEDGIDKILSGITTIEELLRVAEPPKKYKNERK